MGGRGLLLACIAGLLPAARGLCVLELAISTDESVIDVAGNLGPLDIELQGLPPRAAGTLILSTTGDCPSTPEGWNLLTDVMIAARELTVTPELVELKAAIVHIKVTGERLSWAPTPLRALPSGTLHAEPRVTMTNGTASIGRKSFDLRSAGGIGSLNATVGSTEVSTVELLVPDLSITFFVNVSDIEGNTKIVLTGSIVAHESAPPTIERASRLTAEPDAKLACATPCSTHSTCTQAEGGPNGVGYCKCNCNFIGEDCSRYAPLRLTSVDPLVIEPGVAVRITIVGNHLGEIAELLAPPAEEGPAFRVKTSKGVDCTGLVILDDNSISCELPAQVPGASISLDVKRGCASAPFSPGAMLTVSGCADPASLSCGENQLARADGCGCECTPGWRGQMCNSCAADSACLGLAHGDQMPASDAQTAADAASAALDGPRRRMLLGSSKRMLLAGDETTPAPEGEGAGEGALPPPMEGEEEELVCRQGDFSFYPGTYLKVLSCSMDKLPDGIEPLVISLACARESLSGDGTCTLLVAPANDEDRAEIGKEGYIECIATGCALTAGTPTGHCTNVSCSFGIYEAAIRAAMPDLKIGGPSDIACKPKKSSRGDNNKAQCFVDVDVLPFDIMAECTTSDCVDPALMSMDEAVGDLRVIAVAISVLLAGVCLVALLLLWCQSAMRMLPMQPASTASSASGASGSEAAAHMTLPDDLNDLPHIDKLIFDNVRVRVSSGREIVRGASGVAKAGEVYGVIGASGSGKTTLLDAVAGVLAPGATREGRVLVGGHAIPQHGVRLPAMVGYVRQEDNLSLTLTPRECVWFAAQLTLPVDATKAQRSAAVDSTLLSLGLSHIANTQLGGNASALQRVSGGEKRRVAIAMSMVCSPRVLLLDEPTSGLDSSSAHRIVATLRELASHGRVVMLSIHQPAQRTFEMLSTALLMHQGAPVVVGSVTELYERIVIADVPCPPGYNLADHLLDVTADPVAVAKLREGAAAELDSRPLEISKRPPDGPAPWEAVRMARGWKGGLRQLGLELRALYWRIGLNVYRHPSLLRLHLGVVLVLGPAVGLVFHGVGNNLASFQNRSGACFFVLCLFGFSGLSAMEVFISEQEIMLRELQQGYYRLVSYFVAKISVDALLLRALPAILFSLIFYPTMGLRAELPRFETFVTVATLINVCSGMLCAAISVLFDSLGAANLAATILMLLLLLMNGALVNLREVARPLQVGQSLSFFRYGFEALLTNELEDTIVMVDAPGIMPIPVKSRVFLAILGMDADNIPNDKSVLALFCVGHAALALLLLYVKASTWRPKFLCRPPVPRKRTPGEQVLTEVAVVNSKKGHSTALL